MKKLLLMLLLVVGGVGMVNAKTIRFVVRDEVGMSNSHTLYIHVYGENNYAYASWPGTPMNHLGWDGAANWYERFLDIPEDKLSSLEWIYTNNDEGWGNGKQTIASGLKDCATKEYHSFIYAGESGQNQNLDVVETKYYLCNTANLADKTEFDGEGVEYSVNVSVDVDKDMLIIPNYVMQSNDTEMRFGDYSWNFVYRPNISDDQYWVHQWNNYSDTGTMANHGQRWLIKPLTGVTYSFAFNTQTKNYTITPYFERTLNDAAEGYATFSSSYNVAVPEGLTAKYSTGVSANGKINWVKYDGYGIPANEGALLQGTAGTTYKFTPATSTPTSLNGSNILKPIATKQQLASPSGATAYILSKVSGNLGFYKVNSDGGSWVAAGTAYLEVPQVAGARDFYLFDNNETTSINTIEKTQTKGLTYNLNGQRVTQPAKGLYIVNGKKVIMK